MISILYSREDSICATFCPRCGQSVDAMHDFPGKCEYCDLPYHIKYEYASVDDGEERLPFMYFSDWNEWKEDENILDLLGHLEDGLMRDLYDADQENIPLVEMGETIDPEE